MNSHGGTNDSLGHRSYEKTTGLVVEHLRPTQDRWAARATGSVQRTFTWGLDVSATLQGAGGVGGLLLIDDELTSRRYYPIYDGSRNMVGLYDQDGALAASYEYDAFGRTLLQSSGDYSDDNPFRFSTKYTDDETGLVYYGHRYYEPELGRFINRDPIEEDGGLNLYGFVGNNPVNFYDYLGMDLGPPPDDAHKNEEADPRYPFTWASEFYQENGLWKREVDLGNGSSGSVFYDPISGEVSFDVFAGFDLSSGTLGYIENFAEIYDIIREFEEANHFEHPDSRKSYLERTLNQVIFGAFSDDVTAAGTAVQALLGLTGLDVVADIRDISHNLINWEWSWKHVGKFGVNVAALAPGLGVIKSADKALGLAKAASKSAQTSRTARREAMRQEGIPTSQQPVSQSRNASGREYTYETPKPGGGTQIRSVQQQTKDRNQLGQQHWEAGTVKTDPQTGEVVRNRYGRQRLKNDKSKEYYAE